MISLYKTFWDDADIEAMSSSVKRGTHWAEGPNIELFEQRLIEYTGAQGALVCNSGTSALHLAMMACGIKHFHEVIVPSFTFIATANAVRFVGAKPVFADIEEQTLGLDPVDVERKITPRTKAIIAVHYAGYPCKIKELRQIANKHHLILVEDAAEALGAEVGNYGACAILSFCANKIISTGEGGALLTSYKGIYDKARLLRSHGREKGNVASSETERYVTLGYNFRMSDMTAALGVSQLAKISMLIQKRREIAAIYREQLSGKNILLPPQEGHVYQLFTIRIPDKRDKVKHHLLENGVMSKVYFYPVHQTEFYQQNIWHPVSLPITEQVSREVLSLPIYPGLTETEVEYICQKIKEC